MTRDVELDVPALIREAKKGNLHGLGPLLKAMRPILKHIAWNELPREFSNQLPASDLVQDALLSALRDIGKFHGATEDELFAWLVGILRHVTSDAIKFLIAAKRDCRRNMSINHDLGRLEPIDTHTPSPTQRASHKEEAMFLANGIGQLPKQEQQLVWWLLDGKEPGQIAEELAIRSAAVYKRLARAVELLCGIMVAGKVVESRRGAVV
jgi:RNA polymerase sigma factor (sigma-70 family)